MFTYGFTSALYRQSSAKAEGATELNTLERVQGNSIQCVLCGQFPDVHGIFHPIFLCTVLRH